MTAQRERIGRLRAAMRDHDLEALLVSGAGSVRWLTGYGGSNGVALVTQARAVLFTDFRYADSVEQLRSELDVEIVDQNLVGALAPQLSDLAGGPVGFESHQLSHAAWTQLGAAGTDLRPTTMLLEHLRAVKSPEEVELLRRASQFSDEIYAKLADDGIAGRTERAVAYQIEDLCRELGDGCSFAPVVAAAENGGRPHAVPRDVEIERGTLVVIDLGVLVQGYHGDCTRTFATGTTETEHKEVYEVVLAAQQGAKGLVRAGASCSDVHAEARRVIGEAGYGDYFKHGTGHGVGVEIHEEPRFRDGLGGTLEVGNVVSVEPGIYLPGRFGVRIEDLAVVTDDGCETLTGFPTSLLDIG